MDRTFRVNGSKLYTGFTFFFVLMILCFSTSIRANTNTATQYSKAPTTTQLAHYNRGHPHRHWRNRHHMRERRYYPRGVYWTRWHRINRYCDKRCLVNRWGRVVRCVRRCY